METTFKEILAPGTEVDFTLSTGEKGFGVYQCTKESTGSHLIENVTMLTGGRTADYVWAETVTKSK